MPNTRINCPNCRQPIVADVEQLFDMSIDPTVKQKLLSGAFNLAQCPHCGFTGNLTTPIVYHDSEKELLLTYVPTEVNLPRDEQERLIGTSINRVVSHLPQEQRKGYLLQPQSFLTMQSMIERILEADGITHEMIEAQQKRLDLLQRLLNITDDSLTEVVQKDDDLIDSEFFLLLSRLLDTAIISKDQESANKLRDLQKKLMPITTFGRQVQEQTEEVEAAVKSLREVGDELTRDKLLELVINAPNETRLSALVSLARPGMDYEFFSMLSDRIDRARGDGRARLIELREHLLDFTQAVDKQMESRANQAQHLLHSIINTDNVEEVMVQSLPAVDEFFLQELNSALETARNQGDLEKIVKLQKMQGVIEEASAAPPEVELIQELIDAPDDRRRSQILEVNRDKITTEFLDILTNIVVQVDAGDDQVLAARVKAVYNLALRFSMEASLKK